jgi:hypothetical protein
VSSPVGIKLGRDGFATSRNRHWPGSTSFVPPVGGGVKENHMNERRMTAAMSFAS